MTHADAFLDAYIHESKHPDCRPDRRFRAVMPSGVSEWFGTRDEARKAVATAVGYATRPVAVLSLYPESEFDREMAENGPAAACYEAFGRWTKFRRELDDDGRDSSLDMIGEWADSEFIGLPKGHVYPVRVHGVSA